MVGIQRWGVPLLLMGLSGCVLPVTDVMLSPAPAAETPEMTLPAEGSASPTPPGVDHSPTEDVTPSPGYPTPPLVEATDPGATPTLVPGTEPAPSQGEVSETESVAASVPPDGPTGQGSNPPSPTPVPPTPIPPTPVPPTPVPPTPVPPTPVPPTPVPSSIDHDGDGYSVDEGDCNDGNGAIHPGVAETCDGIDQDCDGSVDEQAVGMTSQLVDEDGDGYGDPSQVIRACPGAEGATTVGGDCDDLNPDIHVGATEICNDIDDNCDLWVDNGVPMTSSGCVLSPWGVWLPFDEGQGDMAYDASGNGYDGVLESVGWEQVGYFGKAVDFEESDARVEVSDLLYAPYARMSVSFWFRSPAKLDDNDPRIQFLSWEESSRPHIDFNRQEDGAIGLYLNTGGQERSGLLTSQRSWSSNTWYHLVFSFDGITGKGEAWVNGVLSGTRSDLYGQQVSGGGAWLGSRTNGDYGFEGQMDDFRIYDWVLSKDEIGWLYTCCDVP